MTNQHHGVRPGRNIATPMVTGGGHRQSASAGSQEGRAHEVDDMMFEADEWDAILEILDKTEVEEDEEKPSGSVSREGTK